MEGVKAKVVCGIPGKIHFCVDLTIDKYLTLPKSEQMKKEAERAIVSSVGGQIEEVMERVLQEHISWEQTDFDISFGEDK